METIIGLLAFLMAGLIITAVAAVAAIIFYWFASL